MSTTPYTPDNRRGAKRKGVVAQSAIANDSDVFDDVSMIHSRADEGDLQPMEETEDDESGEFDVEQIRALVHDCIAKNMLTSAVFFADKLVTVSDGECCCLSCKCSTAIFVLLTGVNRFVQL
jgi:hypothetical protein